MSAGRDLNALLQLEGEGAHDEFTLLLLACFNGHTDAVETLLRSREVRPNRASPHQQWTPLFAAAETCEQRGFEEPVERDVSPRRLIVMLEQHSVTLKHE